MARSHQKGDSTFDRTHNRPANVLKLVSRDKEINSQKYAAGTKPLGGGQSGVNDNSNSQGSY
jgi:hypothetical protein